MDMQRAISATVKKQQAFFATGKTKNVAFRAVQLKKLRAWVKANEERICAALHEDLNKTAKEAKLTEVLLVQDELRCALHNLYGWTSPKWRPSSVLQFPSVCRVHPEPYGVALVMSPWNYPFLLCLSPLVGAIAAGNCVVLKPSAYAPATQQLLYDMAAELFDDGYVNVIMGGRKEIGGLLQEKFDHIFFTGSPSVGRLVMESAAKNLTPVTLELGGKSPCIVDRSADLERAAKRIAWGKCINSGQTCIAPDYLLVHKDVKYKLVGLIEKYMREFYGGAPESNPSFPKIINEKHYKRLLGLLKGEQVLFGGEGNDATLQISPALVEPAKGWDSPLMREEIFGPVLPVLTFTALDDAIAKINARPKPLALYLFTQSAAAKRKVLAGVSFGGGCVNDTLLHIASVHAPFGGVGESGMGGYHGKKSFQTFSHEKTVLEKGRLDFPVRYPPFSR